MRELSQRRRRPACARRGPVDDHVGQEALRGAPARGLREARRAPAAGEPPPAPSSPARRGPAVAVRLACSTSMSGRRRRSSRTRRRSPAAGRARPPPASASVSSSSVDLSRAERSALAAGSRAPATEMPARRRPAASVDPEDRVQVGARPAGERRSSRSLRSAAGRLAGAGSPPRAARAHDLQRRRAAGPQLEAERPLRDQHLEPVDGARAMRSGGGEQLRGSGAVDEVDDIRVLTDLIERQSELVERLSRQWPSVLRPGPSQAHGGAVDEQIGRPRALDGAARRAPARAPAARSGVRFQTDTSLAPASRSAHTAARALPPAPSTSARMPAQVGDAERGDQPGRVGVLGRDRPVGGERERVGRADLARGRAAPASASASAACLWGIVTLAPRKPAGAQRARRSRANSAGGTGRRW